MEVVVEVMVWWTLGRHDSERHVNHRHFISSAWYLLQVGIYVESTKLDSSLQIYNSLGTYTTLTNVAHLSLFLRTAKFWEIWIKSLFFVFQLLPNNLSILDFQNFWKKLI